MATKKISDLTVISAMADDVNIPGENTTQTYRVTGAQLLTYMRAGITDLMKNARDLHNLGLQATVSGNALTVALKQLDGSSDPSSSAPVKIGFRGTTAANGDSSLVSATAATSVTISSGSTLGTTSGKDAWLYVYAINNGGTIELGVSSALWDEGSLASSTAEGGAGAADSATPLYSTTARSSKAIRLIGRILVNEATAGTWASAPTEVSSAGAFRPKKAPTITRLTSGSGTYTVPTPAPAFLRVRMIGGGGGGGGSGTTSGTAANNGGDSTFSVHSGSAILTAGGGLKGAKSGDGGLGGTNTFAATGATKIMDVPGGSGGASTSGQSTSGLQVPYVMGGQGGAGFLGGAGFGGSSAQSGAGGGGATNTGGGGGGGYLNVSANGATSGSGGGSGGYIEAIIENPAASYDYAVGASGSGQAAGTSGAAGGAGAAGVIVIEEVYA